MNAYERRARITELQQELSRLLREEYELTSASAQLVLDECRALKKEGRMVEAIKHYRNRAGSSLRDAKNVVDGL